jgi:phosphatidylserine/phosphatidylglycerophosphate/cardiolipin synthase-like enzyme
VNDQFGPTSPANTPFPLVTVNGTQIEVLFSPEDHPAQRILELIRGAQSSIYFMAFAFTSDEIGDAMLERAAAGVKVQGVFEESQYKASQRFSEYDRMQGAPGVTVRLDSNPYNMHHKVIVIDGQTVITGSYNFSAAAEKSNDENVIIFHNPDLAAQYGVEFVKVFEAGR